MANTDWFNEARYGMFIHWGAYSVAARGEWTLNRECMPYSEYIRKYVNAFKAERYTPEDWAALAREAGMKYMVLTTKHHDGFALFDSELSDFTAAKLGPKRDLVRPYVEACRAAGLKVGLYFSFADWHHPDYPGAYCRDWPTGWKDDESRRRFIEYSHGQVRELLTHYGRIDILWWDGCGPQPTDGATINAQAKRLQPGILINPSNGEPCDFGRCEQEITVDPNRPWEACMTLNENWAYHAGDADYKSPKGVIQLLIGAASQGGNLLLNVGPEADGTIPQRSMDILQASGDWLKRNYAWLPNSGRCPFKWNHSCLLSVKENKVYLHFHKNIPESTFCLAEIKNKVLGARYLDGGQPIEFEQKGPRLFLNNLPTCWTDPCFTTIELQVEGTPTAIRDEGNSWID